MLIIRWEFSDGRTEEVTTGDRVAAESAFFAVSKVRGVQHAWMIDDSSNAQVRDLFVYEAAEASGVLSPADDMAQRKKTREAKEACV